MSDRALHDIIFYITGGTIDDDLILAWMRELASTNTRNTAPDNDQPKDAEDPELQKLKQREMHQVNDRKRRILSKAPSLASSPVSMH